MDNCSFNVRNLRFLISQNNQYSRECRPCPFNGQYVFQSKECEMTFSEVKKRKLQIVTLAINCVSLITNMSLRAVSTMTRQTDELNKRPVKFWLFCLARQCRNGRKAEFSSTNLALACLNRQTKLVQLELNILNRCRLIQLVCDRIYTGELNLDELNSFGSFDGSSSVFMLSR